MTAATVLVARLHEAIHRRDADAVAAVFHPDALFNDYLDGGKVIGREGARAFYRRLFETLAPNIDLLNLQVMADGRVRADMQVSVPDRSGHLWSDSKVTATYVISEGLILSLELGPDA